MTHHLLPHIERGWLAELTHVFLIRDPREVLASYLRSRATATVEDIGLTQELELFEYVRGFTRQTPPVIDAGEFLKAPERHLRTLCERLGIAFTPRMLKWPPGPRASDGVWAPYWYDAVLRSSGFEPYRERTSELAPEHAAVVAAALPAYRALLSQKMQLRIE